MKKLTPAQKKELIDELKELQQQLCETVNSIAHIAQVLDDQHALHYVVAPLQIAADTEHGWLTRGANMTQWIEELEGKLNDDDDDEDDTDDDAA